MGNNANAILLPGKEEAVPFFLIPRNMPIWETNVPNIMIRSQYTPNSDTKKEMADEFANPTDKESDPKYHYAYVFYVRIASFPKKSRKKSESAVGPSRKGESGNTENTEKPKSGSGGFKKNYSTLGI